MNNLGAYIELHGGVFSRAEAVSCGETDGTLARAVRRKEIVRLRRGMYAPYALFAELDETGRHLLQARAVVLSQRGAVALTGPSAAALHGFDLYGQDLSHVHVLRLDRGSARIQAGVAHHETRREVVEDVAEYGGLLAVPPVRAVWEVVRRSPALEGGVVTADSALRLDPSLIDPLQALADEHVRDPGSAQGRLSVRLADGRAESAGESVSRVKFYRYGIPQPELQFPVHDSHGELIGTSDFAWEEHRHLGEFDGKIKYDRLLRPNESPSDRVFREKKREDRMRGTSRGMTRFVWAGMMHPRVERTMAELREMLQRSQQLYVRVDRGLAS